MARLDKAILILLGSLKNCSLLKHDFNKESPRDLHVGKLPFCGLFLAEINERSTFSNYILSFQ